MGQPNVKWWLEGLEDETSLYPKRRQAFLRKHQDY